MSAGPRVLIVEDDADVREAIVSAVEDQKIPCLQAANGLEALELLERETPPPDVILLDVMMPVMDGWGFRARQQATPRLASIPVVVLTAHASARETAEKMDAAGFLRKPVDLDLPIDTIRRLGPRTAAG